MQSGFLFLFRQGRRKSTPSRRDASAVNENWAKCLDFLKYSGYIDEKGKRI